jgi:hypothetical protein
MTLPLLSPAGLVPTTQPCDASAKATPERFSLVPEVFGAQVVPPSVVARIVPLVPTAQAWLWPALAAAFRKWSVASWY